MPLAPKFTTSAFPISKYFTLKNFVRSRRDWEKKCREGSRHSPSSNRYGFANCCILLVPFLYCHAHPWGREGVGGILLGGKGESKAWDDDDVGLMMKWFAFYILYTMAFLRAPGEHILLFCFAFTFRTLLCSLHTLLWKLKQNWGRVLSGLEKMKT